MTSSTRIFWIAFSASCVIFFAPLAVEEPRGLGLDKLIHSAIFAVLYLLAIRAYASYQTRVVIFLCAYAYAIEIVQGTLLSTRRFDYLDIVFDVFGLLVVVLAISFRNALRQK